MYVCVCVCVCLYIYIYIHIHTHTYTHIHTHTQVLVLRRFVLRLFNFTILVESDRALPTCGASLSQFQSPFSTYRASSSFPVCTCFFFSYFSAVLLSWQGFFHQKDRREEKIKTVDVAFYLDVFWTTARAFFNEIKSDLMDFFPIIRVIFYTPNSLN